MTRQQALRQIQDASAPWDVLVIGGGATGLGTALDAATRGYRTLLVEQHDFVKGTSSRSTKLIHGGFRYLKQGQLSLVRHSLRERGLLLQNAPHLVHPLPFLLPNYAWWERPYYGAGLKLYDLLAGALGLEKSRHLDRAATLAALPTLQPQGLRGAIRYLDGQFDDTRLAIALLRTLQDHGGVAANYLGVTSLLHEHSRTIGAIVHDAESHASFAIRAKTVINATGVFVDALRQLDDPHAPPLITASQGAHLVLDRSFFPGAHALMIPRTQDGRILFAIPWHERVLIGTTDTPARRIDLEPAPRPDELQFLLEHAARYLTRPPAPDDLLSVFAGLRPLVSGSPTAATPRLTRDHLITTSRSGLVTVTGGKWTTFRQMAEETVNAAVPVGGLPQRPCRTRSLPLHGATTTVPPRAHWQVYGTDAVRFEELLQAHPAWAAPLHPRLPYLQVEIVWAARHEMARTLEDVLARRTRALLLDARASLEAAPAAAAILASELGRDATWEQEQVRRFGELARAYLP